MNHTYEIPIWRKYTLTVEEAAVYFRIGEHKLRKIISENKNADYLLQQNTLMLHGSTVAVDNKAYLFTAPCGTVKSTHTRLCRE